MKFIKVKSLSGVEYTVNKDNITFIVVNDKGNTVIQLSCCTVIEIKGSVDYIVNL